MHAAVVRSFGDPPRYEEYPEPDGATDGLVVDVLAAGLHPRVRSQADGSHYTSRRELPLVPGVDGVVRDLDGNLRYAALDETTLGTMAERTIIDPKRSAVLPEGVDPVRIAAAMNPAMSAWIALRRRIEFQPDQSVLILGASGNAGRLAIQVARRFGASSVLAVARDESSFPDLLRLGADDAFTFDEAARGAEVDVVIDYVWGEPTAAAMVDVLKARTDRGQEIKWIQIGSVGGLEAPIPSAALRSARLTIVGSGIGSVPGRFIIEELPDIARAINDGLEVRCRPVPLSDVESTWNARSENGERIVFVP